MTFEHRFRFGLYRLAGFPRLRGLDRILKSFAARLFAGFEDVEGVGARAAR
jgi:hypothetical protein